MKVTRADQKGQTTLLTVKIEKADYADTVAKKLKEYRKKANVPGFRVGMAPMSLIEKMYGRQTLVDTAYNQATEAAFDFLKTEAIDPIGDMMPAEDQPKIDFDQAEDFEFVFEIGLAPEVNSEFSDKDKIEKIVVTPSDDMVKGYTDNFLRRYGKLVDVDVVVAEEAISCTLDNSDMKLEDAYVGLISMSEEERAPFIGKKVGDKLTVNINELYKDPKQRAAILSVDAKELDKVNPVFEMEITKIRAFENPKIDAEFLAMAYPDGDVKTKKDFDAKMKAAVEAELASQTEFKWEDNIRDYSLEKAKLSLPEEFLKRWLFSINEGKFTMEQIDAEFPQFIKMMQWDLIKRKIAKDAAMEITNEDVVGEAKNMALAQFRYYGMATVADDMLDNYAKQILSNKDEARKIYDRVGEKKILGSIAEKVTVKEKKMTIEEFSSMMQAK